MIEVDLKTFEISENLLNHVIHGVTFKEGILSANYALLANLK